MGFRQKLLAVFTAACLLCSIPTDVLADTKTGTTNTNTNTNTNTSTASTQVQKIKDKSFNKNKNITIREGETFKKAKEYIWISYQPKADGYLTIQNVNVGNVPANGYLALYNKTKSVALSSRSIAYSGKYSGKNSSFWTKNVFGLRKGETYYIRVKAYTVVTLKSSFKKVQDKAGALQSKALNVKKNKTKTGLIPAGGTTPDWYKINLTKNQKIKLYYNIRTKGSFRLSLYTGRRRLASRVVSSQGEQKMTIAVEKIDTKGKRTYKALQKGTYYLKVEPETSLSSGYYTIKWK